MAATTIGNSANYTLVISDHATPASGNFAWYSIPQDIQLGVQFAETIKWDGELGQAITYQMGKILEGITARNVRIESAPSGAIAFGYTSDTIASGQGTAVLTMTTASTIALNALAGLQCTINGVNYTIASNTATTGADIVVITLTGNSAADVNGKSLTILTAFAEYQKLMRALYFWACGGAAHAEVGGYLLYITTKDVNGNDWTKICSWESVATLATFRGKMSQQQVFLPNPDGTYLIQQLRIARSNIIVEPT